MLGVKESSYSTNQLSHSRHRLLWWSGRSAGAWERLEELGYTGVIVEDARAEEWLERSVPLWVHLMAPEGSLLDESYCDRVWEKVSSLHEGIAGIFWESPYQARPCCRDHTDYDLLLRELQTVEAAAGDKPLIFYPSTSDPSIVRRMEGWLEDLVIDVASGTTIAFSAVGGLPTEDQLPLHSFWKRVETCRSTTPLLPILNVGCVGQGECLWPIYTADLVGEALARMTGPGFRGLIAMAASVPQQGCQLDANLWVAQPREYRLSFLQKKAREERVAHAARARQPAAP